MKGTPKKEASNLDVSAAMETANKLTEMTNPQKNGEKEEAKLVSIRMKEGDYNKLKGFYGSAGLSLSAGLKLSAFYLVEMVEQGAFSLSKGGFIDKRGIK